MYVAAASGVVDQYIGKNFFAPDPDPFLGAREVEGNQLWFGYLIRILFIGETLFLLRSCSGFPEICRRMRDRDLKATTFEMQAAKMFLRHGFDIQAKPETKIKGEDFDFAAVKDGLLINAEVTALEDKPFSIENVVETLNKKRRQVPKGTPAVLFCVIPESWDGTPTINLNWALPEIAVRFLRGTRRINAVVFEVERHRPTNERGSFGNWSLITTPYENERPDHAIALDCLRFNVVSPEIRRQIDAATTPQESEALANETRKSEFYRWVDSLVP
jgi:hypothetical protein